MFKKEIVWIEKRLLSNIRGEHFLFSNEIFNRIKKRTVWRGSIAMKFRDRYS